MFDSHEVSRNLMNACTIEHPPRPNRGIVCLPAVLTGRTMAVAFLSNE